MFAFDAKLFCSSKLVWLQLLWAILFIVCTEGCSVGSLIIQVSVLSCSSQPAFFCQLGCKCVFCLHGWP
jgi:hypothetical protein